MRKQHRLFWYIAFGAATAAAIVLLWRNVAEAPRTTARDDVVRQMMDALEDDPLARTDETRTLVTEAASLAVSGELVTAETLYALGFRLRKQEAPMEAEAAFRRSIALRPGWSWPWKELGIALYNQDKAVEAEQAFDKAIALDPGWSRPYNDFAILLRREGRLDEAREAAEKAVELDPDSLAAQNNFGNLLVSLGDLDQARNAYERAVELDPTHPAPYYNLSCLASMQGRPDDVFPLLEKAIALDDAFREQALKDSDLEAVRDDPRFQALVGRPVEPPEVTGPEPPNPAPSPPAP